MSHIVLPAQMRQIAQQIYIDLGKTITLHTMHRVGDALRSAADQIDAQMALIEELSTALRAISGYDVPCSDYQTTEEMRSIARIALRALAPDSTTAGDGT